MVQVVSVSTLGAGDGADTVSFTGGVTGGSILNGAGADSSASLVRSCATLLGGTGGGTVNLSGLVTGSYVQSGTGTATSSLLPVFSSSTLLGGTGADTVNLTSGITAALGGSAQALTPYDRHYHQRLNRWWLVFGWC